MRGLQRPAGRQRERLLRERPPRRRTGGEPVYRDRPAGDAPVHRHAQSSATALKTYTVGGYNTGFPARSRSILIARIAPQGIPRRTRSSCTSATTPIRWAWCYRARRQRHSRLGGRHRGRGSRGPHLPRHPAGPGGLVRRGQATMAAARDSAGGTTGRRTTRRTTPRRSGAPSRCWRPKGSARDSTLRRTRASRFRRWSGRRTHTGWRTPSTPPGRRHLRLLPLSGRLQPLGARATTPSGMMQLALDRMGRRGTDVKWEKTEKYFRDSCSRTAAATASRTTTTASTPS